MKPDYDAVENFKNSNHEYVGEGAIYIHNTTIPVMIAKVTGCGCCSSEYQLTKAQALELCDNMIAKIEQMKKDIMATNVIDLPEQDIRDKYREEMANLRCKSCGDLFQAMIEDAVCPNCGRDCTEVVYSG